MVLSPIIEREFRLALRQRRNLLGRILAARISVGVLSFLLLGSALFGWSWWMNLVHYGLILAGLHTAIQPALELAPGLFTEERRNQTMPLLWLTGMGPGELFASKLGSGILVASSQMLALFPLLAIPFLTGGISLDLYLATITMLPVVFAFVMAVGVLASVLGQEEGEAILLMWVIGALICLAEPLPYFLGRALAGTPPFSGTWLALSPLWGPVLVWNRFGMGGASAFWLATGVTLAWTIVCLLLAALILRYNWRQEIALSPPGSWRRWWQNLRHGSSTYRLNLRRRWLVENPVIWLGCQDRQPVFAATAWLAGLGLLWGLGWWFWPQFWLAPVNLWTIALIMGGGVHWIFVRAAARRMAVDRRDGLLELFLTTPLSPAEIAEGHRFALLTQFRPFRVILLLVLSLLFVAGAFSRPWPGWSLAVYLLIWSPIFAIAMLDQLGGASQGMWLALNTGRTSHQITKVRIVVYSNLFNFWNFGQLLGRGHGMNRFPSGDLMKFQIVTGIVIFIILLKLLFHYVGRHLPLSEANSQERIIHEMRAIVEEPVPAPDDPRLKHWQDFTKRLPSRHWIIPPDEKVP